MLIEETDVDAPEDYNVNADNDESGLQEANETPENQVVSPEETRVSPENQGVCLSNKEVAPADRRVQFDLNEEFEDAVNDNQWAVESIDIDNTES